MTRQPLVLFMAAALLTLPFGCGAGDDEYTHDPAESPSPLARAMEDAERSTDAAPDAAPEAHRHTPDPDSDPQAPEPNGADETTETTDAARQEPPDDEQPDDAEPAVIEIAGNDQMQFNVQRFQVRTGQPVRILFKNIGQLPKVAMGHNLVILHRGVDMFDFGAASIEAGLARDYIPHGREDEIFAHTPVLGPGEQATLEFTAPEPGEYPYICSFLGHFAAMNGHMVVTD